MITETQRLILKTLDAGYYRQVLHFLDSNRDLFDRFERSKSDEYYTPACQQKILAYEYSLIEKKQHLRLYVFLRSNPDKIIGTVSFSNFKHFPIRSCEIGYKFDAAYHHRGYALETLEKAMDIILTQYRMKRIYAYIKPSNTPSIKLVESLGFKRDQLIPDYAKIQGVWCDHYLYSFTHLF